VVLVEGAQALIGFLLAAWLLRGYLGRAPEAGGILLLVYWALNLPVVGREIALLVRQYPQHRNVTLRLVEPLGALEETPVETRHEAQAVEAQPVEAQAVEAKEAAAGGERAGVALRLESVGVVAGGHSILDSVDLEIAPGTQVAVVGPSGAGKSSLVGLCLGWHRPSSGRLLVDGCPLDGAQLAELRRATAWVDPEVQLWNRSLLANLQYGASQDERLDVGPLIAEADLRGVLESLPEGLQTRLGEGGALVSGGEGQRVRLGRALARKDARLVILDEPFRGLDREKRRALIARARAWWSGATVLFVTHDVGETQAFSRVLVIDGGKLVEDGAPAELVAREGSRYRALIEAERAVQSGLWRARTWRRLRLEGGRVTEEGA
jgi:ATP-binding cassette subfamily B protein